MFSDGTTFVVRDSKIPSVQLEIINHRLDTTIQVETGPEMICVDAVQGSILEDGSNAQNIEAPSVSHLQKNNKMDCFSSESALDSSENKCLNVVVREKKKRNGDINIRGTLGNKKLGTVAFCSMCGKKFSTNYNLKRHMASCKLCPDDEKGPRFQCQCGRTYSQEWDMKKHKLSCQDNTKQCKSCLFPFCNLLFYHRSQLLAHMKSAHNVCVQDPEVIEFNSFDEFKVWKEKIEEESYTYYSKQTGSNVTGVSVNTYYVCQHDGSDRTHSSLPRKTPRRNKKGRVKTGRFCWSQMNVKEFRDGTVRVTFHPSHTHPISAADTEHHPLPSSITTEIERRLTEFKQDTEVGLTAEYNDLKKSRKKGYALNVRTLRALARKNRKLFRITAEALGGTDEMKVNDEEQEIVAPDVSLNDGPMQIEEPIEQSSRDDVLQSCYSFWNEINGFLSSGKLSETTLSRVQLTLSEILETCREDVVKSENHNTGTDALTDLTEVMYEAGQPSPTSSSPYPIDGPSTSLHIRDDDKTVYQVVSLGTKEEPPSPPPQELLYHSAVELVGPREFIIIANEHSQIFHPVHQTNQLNLTDNPSTTQLWKAKR